ncbi:MAG: T9SS type A sorting domain-containing protein, partial [Bacteroidota bacterium]
TTASTVTTLPILAGTFLQDFESYPTGISASFPDGWFNDQNDDEEWTVDAGGTPSGSTGPSVDHTTGTSTGQYIYAETSTWGTGESGIFVSPCLDVSSMNFPGLEFWYHMYGAAMGTLEVGVRVNGVDTVLWSISGQQQGSSGAPWERGAIDLIPYKSQSFQVFFKGTDGSSITGDMALDDIGTFEQPAVDMGVAAVLSPVGASCFGATETLEVTIVNDGLAPIDFAANNAQLDATIAGPNAAAYSITVSSGTLDVDSSLNVVISSAVDLSQVGQNDYTVSITVAGDGGAFNDTLLASSTTIPTIAAPFLEDFESLSNGTPAGDIGNGWINSADDDSDWTIDNGGTGSSNTGPDVDHTTGSSSGKYLYIETSSGSDGDTYDLISPCIDLSGATVPVLSFWYHMAGAHINMLEVYIVDGGTETLVWSQAGAVQSGTAAPWEEGTVSLVGQPSTIQLLFRGYKGTSFEGDIAIDDVGVEDLAGITDLGLSIDAPEDGAVICADTTGALTLTVTNAGGDSVDFAVDTTTIVVNGATSSTTVELNAGKIGFGQSITVSSSIDISMAGNYSYTAYLSGLAADTTNGNDTASATFDVLPAVASLPYVEDFSAGSGGWISGGANSSWAFGVPAGATIDTAASDTNAWVTNLGGDYNPNEQSFVVGPCFDLSNAAADTRIAMSIWVDSESSWDGTVLQASTDDGVTWNNVGALNDPINWYNDGDIDGLPGGSLVGWSGASGGWVRAEHGLDTSLIGQSSVIFRVAFGSDGSFQFEGFAFDDVVVGEAPVVDLGGDSLTVCIGEMLDAGVTPGATYAWSTGASTSMIALTNNTGAFIIDSVISVTVTDTLGFATSASVVVSIAPSLPTVAANITQDINCNGDSTGMISAAVSGANGTVAYSWDTNPVQTTPMLMGLPAGDYTVTITDSAGCTATASANLTEPTALGVGVDSIMGVNCPSDSMGSIEISVSGGTAPYSFVWSNGDTTEDISGLPAGDYTGTITDSLGCVLVSPALNVPSTNNDPVASFDLEQVGGTVNLVSTSTDADSIAWDLGDGVGTSGDDTLSYAYASNDTFVVTLTVFNECGSSSVSDTVFMTQVGLEDELVREINIYPNPSQGQFEVSFGNLNLEEVSLTVVTMAGQLVHAVEVGNVFANHREEITLPSSVAAGVYLLQIRTEETVVYKRLSIEK